MIKRVLFPFVGDQFAGMHISSLLLIDALDRRRYEPVVLVHEDGPFRRHLHASNREHIFHPVADYAGREPRVFGIVKAALRVLPDLRRVLKREHIDIVHANDLRTNLTWLTAARIAGRFFVWHQRAVPTNSPLWRVAALGAHRVICISERIRRALPGGGKPNVSVVANPFVFPPLQDRAAARRQLAAEFGLPETTALIGFVGRFFEQKRPDMFVRAGAAMARQGRDVALLIASPSNPIWERRLVALATELGLPRSPVFLGFRYPIEPVMAGLDVLLVPAIEDGFGRTLVEAAAMGTPVVATDSGGHREALPEGAHFVPPDHPDLMAAAAFEALATPSSAGAALAAAVRTRFSAAAHAQAVMSIYDAPAGRERTS